MAPAVVIAGVGLAVGAVGAYASYNAQQKQAKYSKRAQAAQRAQDNMRAVREKREAIRNARIAAAAVQQNAANQGVSGSSAALGGEGSINSQLNQNLSFLDGMNRLADQASMNNGRAADAATAASGWKSVSNLGMSVFSNAASLAPKG